VKHEEQRNKVNESFVACVRSKIAMQYHAATRYVAGRVETIDIPPRQA
jgi:hypothetical protein